MTSRVLFVISDLEGGGAQRVAVTLMERWIANGWEVVLVTIASDATDFFAVPGGVERVIIDRPNDRRRLRAALLNNRDRLADLRRVARRVRPDIVISFLDRTNVLTLCALIGTDIPVVVSERIDPRQHSIAPVWRLLRRATYPRAAAIVVQTRAVQRWANRRFGGARVDVIPNPVALAPHEAEPASGLPTPYVVGVGRLIPQKGFDVLLSAFGRIAIRHDGWHLVIAGEGTERASLMQQAARLGIADRVHLVGRVRNVETVVGGASMFVLSSRFEGFPNALLEAMALGVPAVSTACPSGPEEIITHERDGLLVPPDSIEDLATAIERLVQHSALRSTLGAAGRDTVADRYSVDRIGRTWDDLIEDVGAQQCGS